ncbi:hypothetical protein HHX48_17685 [Salinimonas sp. HHU 13199]|uniref:Uncharacterized protein n=1 Tax=Salinimonas profundi TaxID=2729140 RepID=A0ABR8LPN5_9ALTE|nr:hypothetical protein [Salinimonas profundi]MBD3587573.1 hypothetical protein [Salinimonas profundi]
MYSPINKMPEMGEPVLLTIGQPVLVAKGYFDGNCFRLTEYAFEYEVLPADVMGWAYDRKFKLSIMS